MFDGKLKYDLRGRVKLGLNFLNNNVDKDRDCLPYFVTIFKNDPAEARHDWPDFGDLTSRYVEGFSYIRKMLNGLEISETESKLRDLMLSYFSEDDGLSYRPKFEKPYYSTISRGDYNEHVAEGFDQARVLWGLLAWYEDSKDQMLLTRIDKMVDGIYGILVKKDDYGYFDRSTWTPNLKVDPNADPMPHQFYFSGTQINPLVKYYEISGNEKALEIAKRLTNYILYQTDYFGPNGSWDVNLENSSFEGAVDGHCHSRLGTLAGFVAIGIVLRDQKLIDKAKKCYDWFYDKHCASFGWSPEFLGRHGDAAEGFETCVIMDQISCALELCKAGYYEYYEQIEKFARNQLMEAQLTDLSLFKNSIVKEKNWLSTFDNVGDMVLGGFVGWGAPNDFIGNCDHHYCLMNCCGPAGIRAMYDVWSNICCKQNGHICVNIFMDYEDKNIALESMHPYEGIIKINVKTKAALRIKRRSWMDIDNIKIIIDDVEIPFSVDEDYINISADLCSGKQVDLLYDLPETEEKVHVNGRDYNVFWKGDTVVDINPTGKIMPLYQGRRAVSKKSCVS